MTFKAKPTFFFQDSYVCRNCKHDKIITRRPWQKITEILCNICHIALTKIETQKIYDYELVNQLQKQEYQKNKKRKEQTEKQN